MAGVADTVDTVAEGTAAAVLSPPCPATLLQMVKARLVAATAAGGSAEQRATLFQCTLVKRPLVARTNTRSTVARHDDRSGSGSDMVILRIGGC